MKSWDPKIFLKLNREDLLSISERHYQGFYHEYWQDAFRIFCKRYLKKQDYELYVDNLLDACVSLVSNDLPPSYFSGLLGGWGLHLESMIVSIAQELRYDQWKRESPKGVFNSERKKSKKEIEKWVEAYCVLNRIITGEEADKGFWSIGNHQGSIEISYNDIMDTIRSQILNTAEKKYGQAGRIVAYMLLGETLSETTPPFYKQKRKGRSEDEFINETVLYLDTKSINYVTIRELTDALQGIKTKKELQKNKNKVWNRKKLGWKSQYEYNADKSIRIQIKRLGGNYLRYLADLRVRQAVECKRCTWGWNERGDLIRVLPCSGHEDDSQVLSSFTNSSTINRIIKSKGEVYYSNALSWCIRQHKSKEGKRRI